MADQASSIPPDPDLFNEHLLALLLHPVADVGFPWRPVQRLRELKVRYVFQLVQLTGGDLISGRHFYLGSLRRVRAVLTEMGLALGMTLEATTLETIRARLASQGEHDIGATWYMPRRRDR